MTTAPLATGYSWNSESAEFTADTQSKTESYQSEFKPTSTEDFSAPAANDFQFGIYKD